MGKEVTFYYIVFTLCFFLFCFLHITACIYFMPIKLPKFFSLCFLLTFTESRGIGNFFAFLCLQLVVYSSYGLILFLAFMRVL